MPQYNTQTKRLTLQYWIIQITGFKKEMEITFSNSLEIIKRTEINWIDMSYLLLSKSIKLVIETGIGLVTYALHDEKILVMKIASVFT